MFRRWTNPSGERRCQRSNGFHKRDATNVLILAVAHSIAGEDSIEHSFWIRIHVSFAIAMVRRLRLWVDNRR